MSAIKFDVDGARAAGYTDAQIADTLASKANFDSAGARAAGFKDVDIISRLAANPTAQIPAVAPVAAPKPEVEDPGALMAGVIGAGRTFDRIGKGMKQVYLGLRGDEKGLAELKAQAADDDKAYAGLQEIRPIATALGEAAPSMIIPIGTTGTALATAGKLALAGGVPSALEYGSVGERAAGAATSAAGAVIGGQVLPKAVGAAVQGTKNALKGLAGNVTPEALALAAKAEAMGIKVNAAQLGDGKFLKTLNSALEQMPFTGGAQTASAQRAAFTRAVSKTFGDDVDQITPAVYAANRTRLGQNFDILSARNNLNITPELTAKLNAILAKAEATGSDDSIRAVKNIIGRVTDQAQTTGGKVPAKLSSLVDSSGSPIVKVAASETPAVTKLPGATYSSLDSELSGIIKAGGEKGNYLKEIQTAVRNAMDDSISVGDKEAWDTTRAQYKNLKAVRNIVSRDGGDGNIPPAQLLNSLNATEAGKEAMAMGRRGTLGDLGRIGKQFVKDSVPNSGTAQRAVAMGLIGGGGFAFGASPAEVAGMLAGGATAGRLVNKILSSPKVIESLSRQGLTVKDLMKLPPATITQIIGGASGMAAAEAMRN